MNFCTNMVLPGDFYPDFTHLCRLAVVSLSFLFSVGSPLVITPSNNFFVIFSVDSPIFFSSYNTSSRVVLFFGFAIYAHLPFFFLCLAPLLFLFLHHQNENRN